MGRVTSARQTRVLLASDPESVAYAATVILDGGLVAFPTETVYGLGANALDATAVAGIFLAKDRPTSDPLIVHLVDHTWLVKVTEGVSTNARRLAEQFWPGPLTLVLPKAPLVSGAVTAGLSTVGVRVPDHPVALALLRAAGVPIAAPSANLFTRPSPTRAVHVLEDLEGRIDVVLDGGPTRVGVESTIVDLSVPSPRLLRSGGTPVEAIETVLGKRLLPPPPPRLGPQSAPGMLESHYAPRTPLVLVSGPPAHARDRLLEAVRGALADGKRVGVLLLDEDASLFPTEVATVPVGSYADPTGVATRLYESLRALDHQGTDVLFARLLAEPASGLGRALADRLQRASVHRL